ncbi:DUF937 domain-containing protein [Ottowia pentelensis]|uniref:DUF937 domain-containing protein n=1 Tax=Ottowia pentelensis TaxID=511108 RepID=UPI00363811A2
MNGSLIDDLMGQMQGAPLGQIAQQLGTDPGTASNAIAAALPTLVGALGHNAQQPGGADALFNALQRDHSGQARWTSAACWVRSRRAARAAVAAAWVGCWGPAGRGNGRWRRRAGQPAQRTAGCWRHPGPHLR